MAIGKNFKELREAYFNEKNESIFIKTNGKIEIQVKNNQVSNPDVISDLVPKEFILH